MDNFIGEVRFPMRSVDQIAGFGITGRPKFRNAGAGVSRQIAGPLVSPGTVTGIHWFLEDPR